MSEITRGVIGMPFEMAMGSELSRRQFYSIAREAYAENQRLLESLQSMIDQTTPLVPIPGDPMWSRRVKIDELMAENESLRKDAERFRRMRAITLEQINDTEDEFDAEFDRQVQAATGQGEQS